MSSTTFPPSELYALQETATSGRGVFASRSFPAGTPIMKTDLLPSYVLYRDYKREVCGQCFAYDQSRAFKLKISETGHAFCSRECLRTWKETAGVLGLEAWTTVETFMRSKNARKDGGMEGNVYDTLPDEGAVRPTAEEVKTAWEDTERIAALIREARAGSKQKAPRKALQSTLALHSYPDAMTFLLSAILLRANDAASAVWTTILDLVADSTPYPSSQDLAKHTRAYLHLLSILPSPLLPHTTAEVCFTLVSRDSHNSFGIRSLDDNGAEMFGYGVWPLASYFNHSCAPSVAKRRVGRAWEFWAARDISEGEELCISYMGGDEADLNLVERRRRSEDIWGFECMCAKCVEEDEDIDEEMEGTSVGGVSI